MKRLAGHPGVEEGIILSTCNRVEVLAQTKNGAVDLRGFLRDYFQLNPADYEASPLRIPRKRSRPSPVSRDLEPGLDGGG